MNGFLRELKRRNVIKVATAYAVVSWLILQVADTVFPALGLPDWTLSFITVSLLLGFPIACVLSWAFELTPDGILRADEVDEKNSITHSTGRKIDFIIIGALALIIIGMVYTGTFFAPEPAIDQPVTAIADKSVAVLPFADLSEAGDQEWFSDGLTEEILNSLTMLPELKVTARTSVFYFKGQNIAVSDIAEQLGVVHVVEGSVRRQGDTLRITAQLIRAEDGFHLWSQTYDRPADDIFDVQRDVAENIARSLDVVLDDDRREAMFSTGTKNIEAFEAYQKGLALWIAIHAGQDNGRTLWDANAFFDKALEHDPRFAAASYARVDAISHALVNDLGFAPQPENFSSENALQNIQDILDKSIELAITEEQKIIYQFLRVFNSDNWSTMEPLLVQIRASPKRFAIGIDVFFEALFAIGEIDILKVAAPEFFERDPYDDFAWYYLIEYHLNQNNCPLVKELMDKNNIVFNKHLDRDSGNRGSSMGVAYLMCQYFTNDQQGLNSWKTDDFDIDNLTDAEALILAINGENEKLTKYAQDRLELPKSTWPMYVGYFMGEQGKINKTALMIDNMIAGQMIWRVLATNYGGKFPFEKQYAPNYVRKLRQAGASDEKIQSMFMPDADGGNL